MSALTSVTAPQNETAEAAAAGGDRGHHRYESLSSIAGLLAVIAGLLSLLAVSVAAIVSLPSGDGQNVVAVTTGSFGVIGTVVGAYFGVKLGADGRQAAQHAQRTEAAKVQALAAHLDPAEANKALRESGQVVPPSL
jgi:divalent metal cation (Fe/Co/Zn/Cd) transporter